MGFADSRTVVRHNVPASVGDNTDVLRIFVPAGRQVQIFNLLAYAVVKSPTAGAKLELVDSANNILLSVPLTHDNGTWAQAEQATPIAYTAGVSGATLKLRTDGATGTGANLDCEVHMQYVGATPL